MFESGNYRLDGLHEAAWWDLTETRADTIIDIADIGV